MSSKQDPAIGITDITEPEVVGFGIVEAVKETKFYPTGAIAFFIALVLLCLAIWFGIYFLMLDRV